MDSVKMNPRSALILCVLFCLGVLTGCDRRGSAIQPGTGADFSTVISLIKDYSSRINRADIEFFREGVPFSEAVIKVDGIIIPNVGGSIYFDTLFGPLNTGLVNITFESDADFYSDTLVLNLPDSFGVLNVIPSEMSISENVFIDWSGANAATGYILGVTTLESPDDGTVPFSVLLDGDVRFYTIPHETFEDDFGDEVLGTYYIYLIAYNRGFLPYVGLKFPLPDDVPVRPLAEPAGTAGYGTIAPLATISVVP
jgi:hypothetical protein